MEFCCGTPQLCDAVCRNRPDDFARRVREVNGFSLDNIRRGPELAVPELPRVVPVVFHGDRRTEPFESAVLCLPLYKVIHRHDGSIRYGTRSELAEGFQISPGVPIILTGTAPDAPLERWWSLGQQRRGMIRELRELGVALVTTPNFSLFVDQPRWDDLHSIKRIAITHEEFLSEGLPAALHVNARTDQDWKRWRSFVAGRPEITHIAFEFTTGTSRASRMKWYADQLAGLAASAERPLHLVVRGGGKVMATLLSAFSRVTALNTSAFVKTIKRQQAMLTTTGAVIWCPSPTEDAEPLDALLAANWKVVAASYDYLPDGEVALPLPAE